MASSTDSPPAPPTQRLLSTADVVATWLPLAGSWILMGLELPP